MLLDEQNWTEGDEEKQEKGTKNKKNEQSTGSQKGILNAEFFK